MKIIKNFIIMFISIVFILLACNFLANLYFKYYYGVRYVRKAIFTKKINKMPAAKLKKYLEEDPEFYLTERKFILPVVVLDIPVEAFKNLDKNRTLILGQNHILIKSSNKDLAFELESEYMLEDNYLDLINKGEYSVAFGVFYEGSENRSTWISIITDDNKEAISPYALYEKDLLMVVFPQKEKIGLTKKLRLKIVFRGQKEALFKFPKIILTPVVPPSPIRNYQQPVNFKKGNKVRIITIGGSTTYGIGSEYNTTWPWPNILQQRLNYFYPDKCEVINLGLWGGSVRDFLESFDKLLIIRYISENYFTDPKGVSRIPRYHFGYKDLEPDIVLIAPCWNDITFALMSLDYYDKPFVFGKTYRQVDQYLQDKLCRSPLGFFIYRALNNIILRTIAFKYTKNEKKQHLNNLSIKEAIRKDFLFYESIKINSIKENYQRTLYALCNKFKSINSRVTLILLPSIVFVSSDDEFKKIQNKLKYTDDLFLFYLRAYTIGGLLEKESMQTVSKDAGCSLLDLLEYFQNYDFTQKDAIFNDILHFNGLGNNYISTLILHSIEENIEEKINSKK